FDVLNYFFDVLNYFFDVLNYFFDVLNYFFDVLNYFFDVLNYFFDVLNYFFDVLNYNKVAYFIPTITFFTKPFSMAIFLSGQTNPLLSYPKKSDPPPKIW
ncbi:MAG: hypothetical protein JNM36_02605, partial [Chitinophagales bacterium]|nr:hypothetical protein [Chitinophagales bacterium]